MEIYIFGIIILLILSFIILTFIPTPFKSTSTLEVGPFNLNKTNELFTTDSFLKNTSVSLQGFIYLEALQKTGVVAPCNSTGGANCSTGRYDLCKCSGINNCSDCLHTGYISLLNINNIISLEALGAPDASRQGRAQVQLTVKTQTSALLRDGSDNILNSSESPITDEFGGIYYETIVLPPLPFQKWIMITISREGRRFDIYYNNTLVISKTTSAMLYSTALNSEIQVGNTTVAGSSGFFTLYPSIQTAYDIGRQYTSFVTTRGTPLFNTNTAPTISWNATSLDRLPGITLGGIQQPSICATGNCLSAPSTPPAVPYYEWSSSYA